LDNGEPRRIAFGGLRVDDAIEDALLSVVGPGAIAAAVAVEKEASQRRDQVRDALKHDLECPGSEICETTGVHGGSRSLHGGHFAQRHANNEVLRLHWRLIYTEAGQPLDLPSPNGNVLPHFHSAGLGARGNGRILVSPHGLLAVTNRV